MPVYIDPTVSGPGTGTEIDPFNSWAAVTWSANETYLQRAGTTYAGAAIAPTQDGVTIGAYGITAEARYARIDGTGVTRPITIGVGRANITVQDIEVWGGTGEGIIASAASSPQSSGIVIQRCYVHDSFPRTDGNDSTAIPLFSNAPRIRQCVIENCWDDAIWVNSESGAPIVENCVISGVGLNPDRFTGDCVQFAAWTGTAIVRRCHLVNLRDKQAIVGANVAATLLVEDTYAVGGAYVINGNGANLTLRRVHAQAVTLLEDAVEESVVYNPTTSRATVLESCVLNCGGVARNGVYVFGSGASTATLDVTNCTLVENLVGAATNGLVRIVGTGASATIQNNYMQPGSSGSGAGRAVVTGAGVTTVLKQNRIIREQTSFLTLGGTNYSTVAAAEAADSVNRSGNSSGDPSISSELKPLVGSPLIAAGTHNSYTRDLEGKQRPNPPSIGAYDVATLRPKPMLDPSL